MLRALSIHDFVLIDQLDLTFSSGLCVLTGETGAGKSILLDALGLVLGARGDNKFVRQGAVRAVITAVFEPIKPDLRKVLFDHGFETDETLTLRRILDTDGRTRAFVNERPVGTNLLRNIGESLVEIQGQFAQHRLAKIDTHRELLDIYASDETIKEAVKDAFLSWQEARKKHFCAKEEAALAYKDEEFLRYALEELDQLNPQPNEETNLSSERAVLLHAEQLIEAINGAVSNLSGISGAESSLSAARGKLERMNNRSGKKLSGPLDSLDEAIAHVEEAIRDLSSLASAFVQNDSQLEEVEERLQALREVGRKHKVEAEDLLSLTNTFRERLNSIDTQTADLAQIENEVNTARKTFLLASNNLSKERKIAATRLEIAVSKELPALKLEKAHLKVSISELEETKWNSHGIDKIEILVSTNPGTPLGPLSKIASGGELSRLMLCLKLALIDNEQVPTLIFDEVDNAIGGATANAVGERLAILSKHTQIMVVTHSPQVAARGTDHLRVVKDARGNKARTGVDRLSEPDRQEEVARMLSGANISTEARAAAKRLISGNLT